MIIGILGKGGSGKSSLSTNLVNFLANKAKVLAIDADHNMDLTFNLSVQKEFPYLGDAMSDIKKACGLDEQENYRNAVLKGKPGVFKLSPKDNFTEKYTLNISENLSLMSAGPQTEDVLTDKSCSHILFTPLKVYLPMLMLSLREYVIVDEKAGADGASSGIPTGFDVALVVAEPTPHSTKTANQIADILERFSVPYEFVINKFSQEKFDRLEIKLKKEPIEKISFSEEFTEFSDFKTSGRIIEFLRSKDFDPSLRFKRSFEKFNNLI